MKKITSTPYLGQHSELTFSLDGKYLFHTEGREVIALNVPWLTREFSLVTPWKGATSVVCHPVKPLIMALGYGPTYPDHRSDIPFYDLETRQLSHEICVIGEGTSHGCWVGDNSLIYLCIFGGAFQFSLLEQKTVNWFWCKSEVFYSLSLHPDGRTFMVSHSAQWYVTLQFLDVYNDAIAPEENGSQIKKSVEIELPVTNLSSAIFSPSGNYFVVTHYDVVLYSYPEREKLWAINSQGEMAEPYSLSEGIDHMWSNAVFSPDSRFLYCGSQDGFIYCWDVSSGELIEKTLANKSPAWHIGVYDSNLKTIVGHEKTIANSNPVWQLAISPDGQLLASSGREYSLTLWDLSL